MYVISLICPDSIFLTYSIFHDIPHNSTYNMPNFIFLTSKVAGFLAALQLFFMYGLPCRSFLHPATSIFKNEKASSSSLKSELINTTKIVDAPYRPPHLRKKEGSNSHSPISQGGAFISGLTSSDSEQSDSDGFSYDRDHFRSSKARVAAIICIQVTLDSI